MPPHQLQHFWEVGPAPPLGKVVELAVVGVWVSWTEGVRAGELAPVPAVCCIGGTRQGRAGELTWVVTVREGWQTDQPRSQDYGTAMS